MTEEKKVKEEAKEIKLYELVKIPTGEALAIQTPSGDILSTEFALVEVLNKLEDIQKAIHNI